MRAVCFSPVLAAVVLSVSAFGSEEVPLASWSSPPFWSPAPARAAETSRPAESGAGHSPRAAFALPSTPLPFIAITPCRQYDSRADAPLFSGTPRTVTLTGAPCGIPVDAEAASVNITIFSITGAGGNGVFKVGIVSPPTTAWINYPPTETQRGNAGVVPLTSAGEIIVQVNQGAGSVDFTVDVNGYYAPRGASVHLLAVGGLAANGSSLGLTDLGTWTSTRYGVGSYGITFAGLNPGCLSSFPTVQLTAVFSVGFVSNNGGVISCGSGDTTIWVSTLSPANALADLSFSFSVYGPSPAPGALSRAPMGQIPSTCTFTSATGVETCQ